MWSCCQGFDEHILDMAQFVTLYTHLFGFVHQKIKWDLANGPLSKFLELLDTQVFLGPFTGSCWWCLEGGMTQVCPLLLMVQKSGKLTSWGWYFIPVFAGFPTSQVVSRISSIYSRARWFFSKNWRCLENNPFDVICIISLKPPKPAKPVA